MTAALTWSPARPIWIDEVIQYSLAPFSTLSQAWRVFVESIATMNPGQTGAYHVANYLLLQPFGASNLALRLPSYLASIYVLWVTLILLRTLGIQAVLRALAVLLITLNPFIVYTFTDARPYIFVILTLACGLLFYLARALPDLSELRRRRLQAVAYPGLVAGALFHPYAILYLFAAGCIGWVVSCLTTQSRLTDLRKLAAFTGPSRIFPVIGLYVVTAALTWYTHPSGKFNFNPYEHLRSDISPLRSVLSLHFQSFFFLGFAKVLWIPILGLLPLALRWKLVSKTEQTRLLVASLLFWMMLGATGIICWQSIRNTYWILPRQWVGSSYGMILAVCIALQALTTGAQVRIRALKWIPIGLTGIVALLAFQALYAIQVENQNHRSTQEQLRAEASSVLAEQRGQRPTRLLSEEAEKLARYNIAEGGPVWPVFKSFYAEYPSGK